MLFAVRAIALLASPYPSEYGEGTTWAYARLILERGDYFLPIADEPWIHATYPPLFPRLHAMLGGTLGAGRTLGLFATLCAAAAIAAMVRASGATARRPLLWAVMFLGAPAVHEWAALCRVDTVALALSLVGLYVASRPRFEIVAAPIFAAAFYAKQIALAAPLAVLLSLWLRGERRRAAAFAAVYGGLVVGTFAILDLQSAGEVHRHLITYAASAGYSPGQLLSWLLRFGFAFPVLIPIALRGQRDLGRSPLALYVPIALFTLVFSGKAGASANYLLEPSAAIVLAAAVAAERRLRDMPAQDVAGRRGLVLLLVVQGLILCGPGRPLEIRDLRRENRAQAAIVAALAAAPGPVLAEDLGLTLAAGKTAMFEPFQFFLLAETGTFDPAPLLADVRDRRFGAIAVGWRLRRLPGLMTALGGAYDATSELGPITLYAPRGQVTRP